MKSVVTVPEDVAWISHTYLHIKAAISFFMDACNQAPLIVPKMQDQKLLTLCWRSFSGFGREREYAQFANQGGQYLENNPWHTNVNNLQLTAAYLNAIINVKPEKHNWRLEPMGLAKPGKTRRSMGMGLGLARQESARWVFGLVGYLHPLVTLGYTYPV